MFDVNLKKARFALKNALILTYATSTMMFIAISAIVRVFAIDLGYGVIKEEHMRKILYENLGEVAGEKVLERWKGQGKFANNLKEFNSRRLDTFKGDYKNFLIQKYGNAYSAYFWRVRRITFTKILATQSNLDFLTMIYGVPFTLNPVQTKI